LKRAAVFILFALIALAMAMFTATFAHAATMHTRVYYIAAQNVEWDYAPGGMNTIRHEAIPITWQVRHKFMKRRFVEYTNATFTVPIKQPSYLGILGPIIRAEVGERIEVHFLNRTKEFASIHPHGVQYDKNNEGANYIPAGDGAKVAPGKSFVYHWYAGQGSAPTTTGSQVWLYHSHVNEMKDVQDGLIGAIIIYRKGAPRPDREFVLLFMNFDENNMAVMDDAVAPPPEYDEGKVFDSINGRFFGNLPGLVMKKGERVRWYILALGAEDIHSAHFHGETQRVAGQNTDVIQLMPGSMVTADMTADNPGTWLLQCHVSNHMMSGMFATYEVKK
jgi:FtsP/CotA-like multicopper oxidase with cupredoxin domain